jgi:hypothetical protein
MEILDHDYQEGSYLLTRIQINRVTNNTQREEETKDKHRANKTTNIRHKHCRILR